MIEWLVIEGIESHGVIGSSRHFDGREEGDLAGADSPHKSDLLQAGCGTRVIYKGSHTTSPGRTPKARSWLQSSVAPFSSAIKAICRSNIRAPAIFRSLAN